MSATTRCCWRAAAARSSRSSAHCSHYHGPLAEGLLVGDTVRCPWHHACFSLRTGEALQRAGAEPDRLLAVEQRGDKVFVTDKHAAEAAPRAQAGRSRRRSRS